MGLHTAIFRSGSFFSFALKNMSNLLKIIMDAARTPAALLLVEIVGFKIVGFNVLSASTPTTFTVGNLSPIRSEEQFTRFKDIHRRVCSPCPYL